MNGTEVIDSSFLTKYKEDLEEVFQTYLDTINPFIVQFEILKNEFPIAIQNEIRAIYGHIVRAAVAEDEKTVQQNIGKIKSHTKRAVLDCYKYICIAYADNYTNFFERYHGVDLSYINNGRFLQETHNAYKIAKEALQNAKQAELSNLSEDALFDLFENAYEQFDILDQMLTKAEDDAEYLKHKATLRDMKSKRTQMIGIVVGIIGAAVGIASLIIPLF